MAGDRSQYLLRTLNQVKFFKGMYSQVIADNEKNFIDWVNSLPLMTWTMLSIPANQEEIYIGLLCTLIIDKKINATFSNDGMSIKREPSSKEELLAWMKANDWHGPGIDTPENRINTNKIIEL